MGNNTSRDFLIAMSQIKERHPWEYRVIERRVRALCSEAKEWRLKSQGKWGKPQEPSVESEEANE